MILDTHPRSSPLWSADDHDLDPGDLVAGLKPPTA
jgi:hypothetical protein